MHFRARGHNWGNHQLLRYRSFKIKHFIKCLPGNLIPSKIVFVTPFPDSADMARQMVPLGYDLVVVSPQSSAYQEAIGETEYLMGFVSGLVRDELYSAAPRLKLIQLLSAGYDDADIDAARRAGVPIANNGGQILLPGVWYRRYLLRYLSAH